MDRIERGLSSVLAVAMVLLRVLEPTCPLPGQSGPSSSKLEACGGPSSAVLEPASPAVEMEASDGQAQASEGDKPQEEVKRDSDAREPGKGLVLGSHEHKIQRRQDEKKNGALCELPRAPQNKRT